MSAHYRQGLSKKQGLTQAELEEIERLAEICNAYEGLDLKLNALSSIRHVDLRKRAAMIIIALP